MNMDNKDRENQMSLKINDLINELLGDDNNAGIISYYLARKSAELSFYFCKDTRVIALNILDAIRDELDFQIQNSPSEIKNINNKVNNLEVIEPLTKTIQ